MNSALVNNKYRITRRIGGGSFGEIYMGIGPTNERVAIKFERQGSRCPQLRHEYKVYRELANSMGFCSVYYFGTQENYNVMVMDLLGPSLEDLFTRCSRRFSLKTVLQIADQILERIDCLHSRHLIHRDIKPANFTIGINETVSSIFCVDFGLSKRFRHPKTLQHIPHRDGRSLTGTPRYASINNHLGIEQSRRDDLESVGYVLIYFLKGSLPWQGLKAKNAQKKYRMILEKKQQVSIAQLCQGLPSQFAEFLAYTRSLKFDAKPDIPYLRKLFRDLYHAQGLSSIGKVWDWDDMDMDYASGGDTVHSGGMGGMLPGVISTIPSGALRPNTAAAVGGMGDEVYGLDEGMDAPNIGVRNMRPSTTGNPPVRDIISAPKYSVPQGGILPSTSQNSSAWMYGSRPAAGGPAGSAEAEALFQQRRPHTAHGSRGIGASMVMTPIISGAGGPGVYPTASSGGGMPQMVDEKNMGVDDEENEDHVVAGARAMMRYRRTRASGETSGSSPGQAVPSSRNWISGIDPSSSVMPKTSALGGYSSQNQPIMARSSATSSGAAGIPGTSTPTSSHIAHGQGYSTRSQSLAQQQAVGGTGVAGGAVGISSRQAIPHVLSQSNPGNNSSWTSANDRPKSASTNASGVGVGTKLFSSGNNATGATGPSAAVATSSGTLPASSGYGSIKNRFIPGAVPGVGPNPTSGTPLSSKSGNPGSSLQPSNGGSGLNSSNGAARSSKLFGLTR